MPRPTRATAFDPPHFESDAKNRASAGLNPVQCGTEVSRVWLGGAVSDHTKVQRWLTSACTLGRAISGAQFVKTA